MKKYIFLWVVLITIFLTQSLSAQFYFGRNKIQYNDFDWHILQTEHFDIYYYPEMKELAEIGAAYAEKTYTYLEVKFNHNILRKIPLIFYATHAHFQETNTIPYMVPEGVGGFFEFLKGRVVIPANGSIDQFKHVICHELTHVFTHSKANRVLKDHKQMNHPGLPLWFVEGLAEYWSEGWDSQAEMFIRDAVLNDYLFPLSRMYQIYGSFLMYKEGQVILKYISENYGDEKLLQLIDNLWMSKQFSDVMRITLGSDYKDFDKEWTYKLKKEFFPLFEDHDSAVMTSEQLTKEGINIKPAFYDTDKSENIVFISNRTGYSTIYVQPLAKDGKKDVDVKVLIEGEKTADFESFHLLNSKIDVSETGKLVFVSKSGPRDNLYVFDIASKKVTNKINFDHLVSIFSPSWAPDGNKIAFAGLAFSGKCDLYSYDVANAALSQLTDDYYDDRDPEWSPDGRFIAFSSDRGTAGEEGHYNLFLYDNNSGLINYATFGKFNDQAPTWSADGKYLAFTSDRGGTNNIWALKTNGHKPQQLFASSDKNLPSVPHVRNISKYQPYFASSLEEDAQLKQLTHFTTGAFDPEWTDNGHLLFTAFENFSFQIHEMPDAMTTLDSLSAKKPDEFALDLEQWDFERLRGDTSVTGIKYKPKFNLDIAQSQITQDPIFGTSGGMQLAISDMLGNYQYYFLLYNNARTKSEFLESFNFAVSRVDLSHRANYALGVYHFAGRYYNRYDYWFWERRYGGFGALSYPFSKFHRIEASVNVRNSDKEWFFRDHRRKALLVSNFISYIKDNSLWGATGPIDGERLIFTVGNTLDVAQSNVNFYTAILDYRRYFRLNSRITHAVRFWTQINNGKEATPFFMGGSWDLRGYGFWRLWGTKLALISNELRFPFIDRFIINFPFGGLGLTAIRGAAFLDVGNAWGGKNLFDQDSQDNKLNEILGSTGFGIRFRFGGVLVLRLDFGRRFTINDPEKFYQFKNYDFDKNWFTQFFFGWDF